MFHLRQYFSVIFLKEVIRWKRIIGICLAFGGVIILIFEPTIFADLGGVYFALLAALSMSVGLIFMKKLHNIKVFDLQAWIAVISCLMLFITSYIFESNQINVIVNANVLGWSAVIFTALVATGMGHAGFLLFDYEIRNFKDNSTHTSSSSACNYKCFSHFVFSFLTILMKSSV